MSHIYCPLQHPSENEKANTIFKDIAGALKISNLEIKIEAKNVLPTLLKFHSPLGLQKAGNNMVTKSCTIATAGATS